MSFTRALIDAGWREVRKSVEYRKGSWTITFDTSTWMEIGTASNPRTFDVPVPEPSLEKWTLNLIEHLCKMEDKVNETKN